MVYSRGEIHGKMEFGAQIVPFHQERISLIFFKSKIKSAVTFTSLLLPSTRLQEDTAASRLPVVL